MIKGKNNDEGPMSEVRKLSHFKNGCDLSIARFTYAYIAAFRLYPFLLAHIFLSDMTLRQFRPM